jgi:hypothetical protein
MGMGCGVEGTAENVEKLGKPMGHRHTSPPLPPPRAKPSLLFGFPAGWPQWSASRTLLGAVENLQESSTGRRSPAIGLPPDRSGSPPESSLRHRGGATHPPADANRIPIPFCALHGTHPGIFQSLGRTPLSAGPGIPGSWTPEQVPKPQAPVGQSPCFGIPARFLPFGSSRKRPRSLEGSGPGCSGPLPGPEVRIILSSM